MYYVYLLKHPETGQPFYAGKGKGKRASYHIIKNQHGKNTENPYKDHVIRQILSAGLVPEIEYIFYSEDEEEAYRFEESTIAKYGRKRYDANGILTNLCESNRPPRIEYTPERREQLRKRMQGNKINTGRVQSAEEKMKRGKSLSIAWETGTRVVTDKMRTASSNTHKGKVVSDETRKKQSISAKKCKAWRTGKTNEEIFGEAKAEEIRQKKKNLPPPNRKEVKINNVVYQSIRAASLALGLSEYKARKQSDLNNKKI